MAAFLVHFQTLCLRRAHKRFSFRNFSLGNGFLTGARDQFSNLPSAIFLFKAVAGVNVSHGTVVYDGDRADGKRKAHRSSRLSTRTVSVSAEMELEGKEGAS